MNSKKIYSSLGLIAPLYDVAIKLNGYERSVNFFVSQLPFKKDAVIKVLDAGCGTGFYSIAVLKRFPNAKVVAFDLEEKLVDRLSKKVDEYGYTNRISLFVADIQSDLKQLDGEKFDLIITAGVLEYVPLKKTVANLARFIIEGGYFFNSPVRNTWLGKCIGALYACKPYSREENIRGFKDSRFAVERRIDLAWYTPAAFKEGHIFKKY